MQNPSKSQQNLPRIHQNLNKTLCRIHHNLKKIHAESIRISTKPMQNPPESQQNLSRIHENFNKTYGESIIISAKSMQNPSESHQNLSRIHQNLIKTYVESMRISTKHMQTPSEDKTIQPRLDSQDTSRSLRSTSSSSIRTARISCYQNSIRCHGKMPQDEKWPNATG